jgi:hypothetical protein
MNDEGAHSDPFASDKPLPRRGERHLCLEDGSDAGIVLDRVIDKPCHHIGAKFVQLGSRAKFSCDSSQAFAHSLVLSNMIFDGGGSHCPKVGSRRRLDGSTIHRRLDLTQHDILMP